MYICTSTAVYLQVNGPRILILNKSCLTIKYHEEEKLSFNDPKLNSYSFIPPLWCFHLSEKIFCESITDCDFQKVFIAQVWYINITCPNKNKSNCYGQAILQRTGLFSAFKSMFSSLILIDSNSLIAFLEARLSYVNINGVFLCDVCARDLAQCTEIGIFDGGLYLSKLSPYLN